MFLKFLNYLYSIKLNFRYLPKDYQQELIDILEEYNEFCILAKEMKKKGDF